MEYGMAHLFGGQQFGGWRTARGVAPSHLANLKYIISVAVELVL